MENKKRLRCHWCKKFISKENSSATVKEPNIFYCKECYKKGIEMEEEAMGLSEESNNF